MASNPPGMDFAAYITPSPSAQGIIRREPSKLTLTASQWFHGCSGSDRAFRKFKNKKERGAASLVDMAFRCLVRNRKNLEEGLLEYIPWEPIGEKFWCACAQK
jgi:hypothetical protein